MRTYTTMTNNEWDITGTIPVSGFGAPWGQTGYRIRFRSFSQKAPFTRLRVFAQFNGVNYDYSTDASMTLNTTTPTVLLQDDIRLEGVSEAQDQGLNRYNVLVSGTSGTPFRLKFIIDSTDKGRMYLL